jgi:hypothetical protein
MVVSQDLPVGLTKIRKPTIRIIVSKLRSELKYEAFIPATQLRHLVPTHTTLIYRLLSDSFISCTLNTAVVLCFLFASLCFNFRH